MVIALNPDAEHRFVLREDQTRDAAEQSVFVLRSLTVRQRTELIKLIDKAQNQDTDSMVEAITQAVRATLVRWENFADASGKPAQFRTERDTVLGGVGSFITDRCLAALTNDQLVEIGLHVIHSLTQVSPEERGN